MIMKRSLLLVLILFVAKLEAAPHFFRKGIDFTGVTAPTASQLNQLVDASIVTNQYGLVIRTNARPSLSVFPGYTNFLWYDTTVSPPSLKGYVCCGDADTNWVAASLGGGTITSSYLASPAVSLGQIYANAVVNSNIANNAVTDVKISGGAINNSHLQGGSVSNANIAVGTITGDRIASLTITDTNIAAATITEGKLAAPLTTAKIAAGGSPSFLATTSGGSVVWTNFLVSYKTNGIAIATADGTTTHAHNLGAVPTFVSATLVCGTSEASFAVGEEIDARAARTDDEGSIAGLSNVPFYQFGWDSANLYVTAVGTSNLLLRAQSSLAWTPLTKANWTLKLDAIRITPTP